MNSAPLPHVGDTAGPDQPCQQTYGLCTHCGAVEVLLNQATGRRDLSSIGEHHAYPTGYGCELCA